MKFLAIIIFSFSIVVCTGQSLGKERIEKLNYSIVRIIIDTIPSGTGFFVHEDGWIATCQHVIEPAFVRNKITNAIISTKKIFIEFRNGEKVEVSLMVRLLNQDYKNSLAFDFSLLQVVTTPKTKFYPLKLGTWKDIQEGDEIYSSGYPLGINQPFISKGILSTKFQDSVRMTSVFSVHDTISRNVAWIDLTLNKGNSGGPIIKVGKKPKDDIVVGIATFILNPFSKDAEILNDFFTNHARFDIESDGVSKNKVDAFFAKAILNNSIGVSGCLSIEYLSEVLKILNH